MALTHWKKPHNIRLPGGYNVPIVYWSDRKMKSMMKNDPTMDAKDLNGYWDSEKIVVNSGIPIWDQIDVVGHEFVHAAHDYALWLRLNVANAMKAEAGETVLEEVEE